MVGDPAVCSHLLCPPDRGGGYMEKIGFHKINEFDIKHLLENLKEEHWKAITLRQEHPGSAHGDTESIYLRWSASMDVKSVFSDLDAVDYPHLDMLPEFKEVLQWIFYEVGGEQLGRAMIVKLKKDGYIEQHVDEGDYADHYDRFHLCLDAEPECDFMVQHGDSPLHFETTNMLPGELWWFDHKKPHCVDNGSGRDRIHLIVDVKTSKFRAGGS